MKKEPIYLLSPKLKWSVFKELQDKLVKDSGPIPVHGDKAIWHLLRENKIYCWFSNDMQGDMGMGLELPLNREIRLIKNGC